MRLLTTVNSPTAVCVKLRLHGVSYEFIFNFLPTEQRGRFGGAVARRDQNTRWFTLHREIFAPMPAPASSFLVVLIIMAMRASIMGSKFALAIFIARYLDLSSLGLYGLTAGTIAVVPTVVNAGMNHLLMRAAVTSS